MKNSSIQWTDHTFNAWEGCTKVAPECKNCYAETLVDHRFGRAKWGRGQSRRRTSENLWKQPLQWNKFKAICDTCGMDWENAPFACCGTAEFHRPRVFCLSLGDWLDDEVPIEWLADLLALIHATPNLDWQLLTKRPENFFVRMNQVVRFNNNGPLKWDYISPWVGGRNIPHNVWIGVSAGADQKAALDIPAKIHFLSCEPMLHPLDATHAAGFDWIIFGGESGKKARPCDVSWLKEGIDFCLTHKIAYFVKQLGANVRDACVDGMKWPNGTHGVDIYEPHINYAEIRLRDSHGGDWNEWPEDLRVREFPTT